MSTSRLSPTCWCSSGSGGYATSSTPRPTLLSRRRGNGYVTPASGLISRWPRSALRRLRPQAAVGYLATTIGPGLVSGLAGWNEANDEPRPADWATRYVENSLRPLRQARDARPEQWVQDTIVAPGALTDNVSDLPGDYETVRGAGAPSM